MQASYNLYLVALSYFIAAYASYATLSISKKLLRSEVKIKWLLAGSATLSIAQLPLLSVADPANNHLIFTSERSN